MGLFARGLNDGARLEVDGLILRLRVNPRARRISLRIDARSGEAVATAPSTRRLADAVAFARDKRGWLVGRLAARPSGPVLADGACVSVLGAPWTLIADGRRPRLTDGVLRGCGDGEVDAQLVTRAIRGAARPAFAARAVVHCAGLGTAMPRIALSDPTGRWGSCTPPAAGRPGAIRLSWRLALAPWSVADYVIAHECAHLVEANHGPRFWSLVRGLTGDPTAARAWLRTGGGTLHAFGRT